MSAPIFCSICGEAFGLTVQQSDTPNVCDECVNATDDGDEQPAESNEDEDEPICGSCSGSGEGMHDGSSCRTCGGSGGESLASRRNARAEAMADEGEDG